MCDLTLAWRRSASLLELEPHFAAAGLPTTGGVQAREFKTGSVSGYAKMRAVGAAA